MTDRAYKLFQHRCCLAVALALLVALDSYAQSTTQPAGTAAVSSSTSKGPLKLERAVDSGLAELMRRVFEMEIIVGTRLLRVSALVAESPEAEAMLRSAILEKHAESDPRVTPDGQVEVDVWITATRLLEFLRDLAAKHLPAVDPDRIALHVTTEPLLMVTGRSEDEAEAEGAFAVEPGWRHCTRRQVELARQAAVVDARHALANRLSRLPIDDQRILAPLLAEHPSIERQLRKAIAEISVPAPVLQPTGVCQVPLAIGRGEAQRVIRQALLADEAVEPGEVSSNAQENWPERIEVQGYAVAPVLQRKYPGPDVSTSSRYDWADRLLTAQASGRAPVSVEDTTERRRLALYAARVEARRELLKTVESLPIPEHGSIEALLKARPEHTAAMSAVEQSIIELVDPSYSNDTRTATVTLGLQLELVARIVESLLADADQPSPQSTAPATLGS